MTDPTPAPTPPAPTGRPTALARYGPIAVVVVAVVLVAVLASAKGRGTERSVTAQEAAAEAACTVDPADPTTNPDLPVLFSEADDGLDDDCDGTVDRDPADFDWGDGCDLVTGRVRLPSVYAPPCVVDDGAEGGDTYRGVTADTIKVVVYQPAEGGDIAASLQGLLDDESVQQDTRLAFVEMLTDVFETWGRTLELEVLVASGGSEDAAAATADAVRVIDDLQPFAVLGGPSLTTAFAERLAEGPDPNDPDDGILCLGCGLSVPDSVFQERAPYMWGQGPTPEQFLVNFGDFLVKRLLGGTADYAGGDLQGRPRVFGTVNFEQDPPVFSNVSEAAIERGERRGFEQAVRESYILDVPRLPERAASIIARMKEAGVTTISFLGDPIMPIYLTQAATAEDYYPEWVIAGTVLTDTTALGRQYDPTQWANAFGLSNQAARRPIDQQEQWRLHQWYFGEDPAASLTSAIIWGPVLQLLTGIHMAGPNLTPTTFQGGLFSYPPSGGGPTTPQISYGDHGYFDAPDYLAVDDAVEVWWDATAQGPDEQGKSDADGMWRYADGGNRYTPGRMPSGGPAPHDPQSSPTLFEEVPTQDQFPDYPPPAGSPAAG